MIRLRHDDPVPDYSTIDRVEVIFVSDGYANMFYLKSGAEILSESYIDIKFAVTQYERFQEWKKKRT